MPVYMAGTKDTVVNKTEKWSTSWRLQPILSLSHASWSIKLGQLG